MSEYRVIEGEVVLGDRRVWSMATNDIIIGWRDTFANILNSETEALRKEIAPYEARIAELEADIQWFKNGGYHCEICDEQNRTCRLGFFEDGEYWACTECRPTTAENECPTCGVKTLVEKLVARDGSFYACEECRKPVDTPVDTNNEYADIKFTPYDPLEKTWDTPKEDEE
jgi:hypothetical protein